jgi:F0F1-type ATP synthase delta subunit
MNNQANKIASTLITHLKSVGELELLPQIVVSLKASSEYKHAENRVVVTSASKLDAVELKGIKAYAAKSIVGDFELEERLDPGLVAGFTLQINDTLIDASISGKISSLQQKLTAKDTL